MTNISGFPSFFQQETFEETLSKPLTTKDGKNIGVQAGTRTPDDGYCVLTTHDDSKLWEVVIMRCKDLEVTARPVTLSLGEDDYEDISAVSTREVSEGIWQLLVPRNESVMVFAVNTQQEKVSSC